MSKKKSKKPTAPSIEQVTEKFRVAMVQALGLLQKGGAKVAVIMCTFDAPDGGIISYPMKIGDDIEHLKILYNTMVEGLGALEEVLGPPNGPWNDEDLAAINAKPPAH